MSKEVVEPSFDERLKSVGKRKYAAILLGTPALLGSAFITSNPDIIPSLAAYAAYEAPDSGDIIPVMDSCPIDPLPVLNTGPFKSASLPIYNPQSDDSLKLFATKTSAAGSMPLRSPKGYIKHERLFWPFEGYFDRKQTVYEHSSGANFEFWSKTDDRAFVIDPNALEQMTKDIFTVSVMTKPGYDGDSRNIFTVRNRLENPQARQIAVCREKAIYEDEELEGITIRAHIIANRNKKLHGNNVVTLAPGYRIESHSHGLGSPNVSINFIGIKLSPEQIIIVAGGNSDTEDDDEALNRLFLHELIHVLFFRDLQETLGDRDRQERYVKYYEEVMWNYYKEKNHSLV